VKGSHPPLAFLFDMDGVLINSMPVHMQAWEDYLLPFGMRVDNLESRMHGRRNPELVRDLFGEGLPEDVVIEHGAAKERLFRKLLSADIEKFRIPGLVSFIRRHADVPKAVGSNAERANVDFILDKLALRPYFQAIVDGSEAPRPKPFPDIYLLAAERLQIEPSQCIVFEDSPAGAEAGLAAEMRVVAIETIPTEFSGVDLVIRDFEDPKLEPWLLSQTSSEVATCVSTGVEH
jgi:haloacid dehalogenase superfamily, subfamily IA, variant 3 with third motif having DD or ED/haloacid dehalogenase superfamily, subfamily IA, variant 1 with third motif having Dx(3-4)D or Dx(3-4)E